MSLPTKNEYMQRKINLYFKMLNDQRREVEVKSLKELIGQWNFDYEMGKVFFEEELL